jgi:putative FmdB family regulatory protein
MPIYTYQCTHCLTHVEAVQKITDEPLETCPTCKRQTLKRKIAQGVAIKFVGSGFYVNDKGGDDASYNVNSIEYPEPEEMHEWECECGAWIVVKFNVELTCKISNISIEAFED